MSFLIVMTIGLAGLLLMALPGLQRHGHAGTTPRSAPAAHGGLRLGHGTRGHAGGPANAHAWARRGESRSQRAKSSGTCNICRRGRESRHTDRTERGRLPGSPPCPFPAGHFQRDDHVRRLWLCACRRAATCAPAGRPSRADSRLWNRVFCRASALEPDVPVPGAAVQFPGNAAFLRGQGGHAFSQRPRSGGGGT